MKTDMWLRSCSNRKRMKIEAEDEKGKNKKKIKIRTLKEETLEQGDEASKSDISLRSCSTRKRKNIQFQSEDEKGKKKKKKIKIQTLKEEGKEGAEAMKSDMRLRSCSARKRKKNQSENRKQGDRLDLSCYYCSQSCSTKNQFKKGDMVNLSQLLFTQDRDFLVTYNDRCGRPVQAKHLEGKVVILHFVPLVAWSESLKHNTRVLRDIYDALHPKGGFEVVFIGVALDIPAASSNPDKLSLTLEKRFEKKFSLMPWTAIPFSDIQSRTYLATKFPLSGFLNWATSISFVIDPTGFVSQCHNTNDIFYWYGAHAYPFTDERIAHLFREDTESQKHLSITKLLASPERSHLINNNNQAVRLHNLEEKVVGLYFYEDSNHNLTIQIQKAYEQLAKEKNFEIVLVYIHDGLITFGRTTEKSYWERFEKMPWLALPYRDPVCKKLQRLFHYPMDYPMDVNEPGPDPSLLIIGPQGKFVEPCGVDILMKYGIAAYPFTRNSVAKLEAERIQRVNLNVFWPRNTSFIQKDGSTVKFSQLVGKRIILVVENDRHSPDAKFWRMLRTRYLQMKGTNDEFEVILVCKNRKVYSYGKNIATMSWLRHPSGHVLRIAGFKELEMLEHVFSGVFGLFAFDRDGRVVRRTLYPSIGRRNVGFPFGDLKKELLRELVDKFEWN